MSNLLPPIFVDSFSGKLQSNTISFSVGEVINGLVLEAFDDNKVLLSIKGQKLIAHTKTPLTLEENISIKVEKINPQIVFQLLPKIKNKVPKSINLLNMHLRSRFPQKTDLHAILNMLFEHMAKNKTNIEPVLGKELFNRLKEVLNSLIYKGGNENSFFKDAIIKSGVMFESKFSDFIKGTVPEEEFLNSINKDIKKVLFESADTIKKEIKPHLGQDIINKEQVVKENKLGEILKTIKQYINNIEIDQIVNHGKEESKDFFLNIPVLKKNTIETARLYVYDRSNNKNKTSNKKKKHNFFLVFFLNMDNLGDLKIDVYINKNILNCKFIVENNNTVDFIRSQRKDLINGLKSINFSAKIKVEKKENIKDMEKEFKKDFSPNIVGMVDMRV